MPNTDCTSTKRSHLNTRLTKYYWRRELILKHLMSTIPLRFRYW